MLEAAHQSGYTSGVHSRAIMTSFYNLLIAINPTAYPRFDSKLDFETLTPPC
jgi:hypothetical protein